MTSNKSVKLFKKEKEKLSLNEIEILEYTDGIISLHQARFTTLDSRINIGVCLLICGLFSRGYVPY